MTTNQIITRTVKRVLKAGYEPIPNMHVVDLRITVQTQLASYVEALVENEDGKQFRITVGLNDMLFDHLFASYVWGDAVTVTNGIPQSDYRFHLQQLAVLPTIEGRIQYIGATTLKTKKETEGTQL